MQINHINIEHFFDLPALVFLKDRQGKYHACNDYAAKQAGFEKENDLIGTTDFSCCWKSDALSYQQMDKKVIDEKHPLSFIETIRDTDQNILNALTYKVPFITRSRQTMVFGISLVINSESFIPDILLGMKAPFDLTTTKIIVSKNKVSNTIKNNQLTKRQLECLYYLVKGMTAAQIADEIFLSKRTVESYMVILKHKLNCNSRSELINKAWEFDYIKTKLLADK